MTLTADDFADFYAAVRGGRRPYPWQEELARRVITTGQWPQAVHIFTGGGKSILPYIHVFTYASRDDYAPRMIHVVPLRALVDSQQLEMQGLAEVLGHALDTGDSGIIGRVARALQRRRLDETAPPLVAIHRRGGMGRKRDRSWVADPRVCAVVTMTRDTATSALLFQGYGTTRNARPVEAGLLSHGSVLVFDEAHTARQAVATARRVRELSGPLSSSAGLGPVMQVVESTATPATAEPDTFTWSERDLPHLGSVLNAHKPLHLHGNEVNTAKRVAELALTLHSEVGHARTDGVPGATVAVVRNTVGDALSTVAQIRQLAPEVRVRAITGRMREYDRRKVEPEIFTLEGSQDVDILVTTQVIEVGVDADWSALITDIAPASTIAQRTGRTGRSGIRPSTPVHILLDAGSGSPYRSQDIAAATSWVESLIEGVENPSIGPNALWGPGKSPVPVPELVRAAVTVKIKPEDKPVPGEDILELLRVDTLPKPAKIPVDVLHRVELADAWQWAESSSRPRFADDDLRLWIADSVTDEPEASIVLRSCPEGLTSQDREQILAASAVTADEVWNLRLGGAQRIAAAALSAEFTEFSGATVISADGALRECVIPSGAKEAARGDYLRAGECLVLWTAAARVPLTEELCLDPTRFVERKVPQGDDAETAPVPRAEGVLDELIGGGCELLRNLPDPNDIGDDDAAREAVLRRIGGDRNCARCPEGTHARLYEAVKSGVDLDIYLPEPESGVRRWALIREAASGVDAELDGEITQILTPSQVAPTLAQHGTDVSGMARVLAEKVQLPAQLADALELAGLYHDLGKIDARFQSVCLKNDRPDHPLAKGAIGVSSARSRSRSTHHLPRGWRHEQLSAALAYTCAEGNPERELISLLCGLSHGRGRSGFPHGYATLTADRHPDAADLFTDGTWERMLHRAHLRLGPWGLAYLDALLRGADNTVSSRGK